MRSKRIPFEEGTLYHLFNHGNAADNLFKEDDNYWFFLRKFQKYVSPIADTFAYCLMPNHFHCLIKTKTKASIRSNLLVQIDAPSARIDKWLCKLEEDYNKFFGFQLSNFFNSYSKSFNKKYQRKGRLFLPSVDRRLVDTVDYQLHLVCYIHCNPVHHGFVSQIEDWPYSSFESVQNGLGDWLKSQAVLNWFGGKDGYNTCHKEFLKRCL